MSALCLAATTHNEARNQPQQAQRAVLCTIINNTPEPTTTTKATTTKATTTKATTTPLCTTAQNPKKYTSNHPKNFAGKAQVSGMPTSHKAQTARIPKSDTAAYLSVLRLATYAVENPQAFCAAMPYHYFNNTYLGKRYPTPLKAKRIGALLFY
jgi:hypothetical protein